MNAVPFFQKKSFNFDCKARPSGISVDPRAARFKLAFANKFYGEAMHMVCHRRFCGRTIVASLQLKGFPDVALHFFVSQEHVSA